MTTMLPVLGRHVESAIAVQRRILAAGDAIDPEWQELGWEAVFGSFDRLLSELPDEPPRPFSARLARA